MSAYREYSEQRFRTQIEAALTKVRTILGASRCPKYAADEPCHDYDDKYRLAEFLTNVAMASQMNVLDVLGVDEEKFRRMHGAVVKSKNSRSVPSFIPDCASVGGVPVGGGSVAADLDGDEDEDETFGSSEPSAVIMRFAAEETCSFYCEELVDADDRHVPLNSQAGFIKDGSEHGSVSGHGEDRVPKRVMSVDELNPHHQMPVQQQQQKRKETKGFFRHTKVLNQVSEYHWKVSVKYSIYVVAETRDQSGHGKQHNEQHHSRRNSPPARNGNKRGAQLLRGSFTDSKNDTGIADGNDNKLVLQSRTAMTEIITTANRTPPLPPTTVRKPIDVDLTWLFRHISRADFNCSFTIDRTSPRCLTPRRNDDVELAMEYFANMAGWCDRVCTYFLKGTAWNVDLAFGTAGSHHARSHHFGTDASGGGENSGRGEGGAAKGGGLGRGGDGGGDGGVSKMISMERRVATLESIRTGSVFNPVLPLFESSDHAVDKARQIQRSQRRRSLCYQAQCVDDVALVTSRNGNRNDYNGSVREGGERTKGVVGENDASNVDDGKKKVQPRSPSPTASSSGNGEGGSGSSPLLPITDVHLFLNEQCRTLDEKIDELKSIFPPASSQITLVTSAEAIIVLLACHSAAITEQYLDGLQSIEETMRASLIRAIGSEVTGEDFSEFIKFHDARLFRKECAPRPLSLCVRKAKHFPVGTVSIESVGWGISGDRLRKRWGAGAPVFLGSGGNGGNNIGGGGDYTGQPSELIREDDGGRVGEPIMTICREVHFGDDDENDKEDGMKVRITASTSAHLSGSFFLHGWISYQFEGRRDHRHQLVARARQFSCFMLLIGSITARRCFQPTDAIIVQNKDEVLVPLILGQIPTADEFYESTSSLSPDQQRFASAVRDIQLESSVFGVCIIQIRPQLEDLLDLPPKSLTKEVQLTEDLLSLFVDHQIPSDLVSFDGPEDCLRAQKISMVKEHVANVQEMIKDRAMEEDETVSAAFTADASLDLQAMPSSEKKDKSNDTKRVMHMFPDISFDQGSVAEKTGIGSIAENTATIPDTRSQQARGRSVSIASNLSAVPKLLNNDLDEDDKFAIEPEPSAVIKRVPSLDYLKSLGEEVQTRKGSGMDLTTIPRRLHAECKSSLDAENSVIRPTIIQTADVWSKRTQGKNLLSRKLAEHQLDKGERKLEKRRAMDLLDALSRSGSLSIAHSELHAIVGATHCFDHCLLDTVIRDNVDPIEKMSRSTLLVASAIHGIPVSELVHENARAFLC